MNPTLEDRLRRELNRTPDGGLEQIQGSGPGPSEHAILAEIRRRATTEVETRNGATNQSDIQRRGAYLIAMAAAVVAAVGGILATTTGGEPSTLLTGPAAAAPDLTIDAPSPLWLIVIVAAGVAMAVPARRLRAGRIAVIAVAVATMGVTIAVASMLPSWNAAERLSTVIPELDGYEPVETGMNWWPTINGYQMLRVDYRRQDGRAIILPNDSADAEEAVLDALADRFGYKTGLTNLGLSCRRFANEVVEEPGRTLTEFDLRRRSDFFCLAGIDTGKLTVTGTEYSANWLWFRRMISAPLIGLALLLALLAVADQRRAGPPRPVWSQLGYAVAVLLIGIALFFTGIFAIDAIRVSGIDGLRTCRDSPDTVLYQDETDYQTCREYVVNLVDDQSMHDPASRLYGPLIVVDDILAGALVAIGGLVTVALARSGHLSVGRRRLLIALVALSLLSVGVQAFHRATIEVTTNAYD